MGPSRTSQAVAVTRAGFARPHSPAGDPDAQRKLCAGMRSVVLGHMRASLEARTIFFDGQVVAAIARGIRQIVVLGAGYDDRALRFAAEGVTFYEVDHPMTQADKRARLARIDWPGRAGPVLVAADFRLDDLASVLVRAGHDPSLPTLFLCEGLLVYLDEQATIGLLSGAAAAAGAGPPEPKGAVPSGLTSEGAQRLSEEGRRRLDAPGGERGGKQSSLAASLATHAEGLDSSVVLARANARRRTAAAEPWLTIRPAAAQVSLLARAGWRVTASVDAADLGTDAEPGRSLLVTAEPTG